jgi:hypothetical protein
MGAQETYHRILITKRERKRPIGISRRKWGDNFNVDLRERGWEIWTGFI